MERLTEWNGGKARLIDTNIWMDDDDFYSHGERKEGADNG